MIGAIIGDIAGSRFEFSNNKSKEFDLLGCGCFYTDDSVMSLAVANAILKCGKLANLPAQAIKEMQTLGRLYPNAGYGTSFYNWIFSDNPVPYNSFGNGAAMRVSACGFAGDTIEEVKALAHAVTAVTHSHPEGLKGAEATACCVFLARAGKTKQEIRDFVNEWYYPLNFTIDEIRPTYEYNVTCQGTVPQAIEAFLESNDFVDAIRTAVSVGGDSDTLAAITGGIAEAFYGTPLNVRVAAEGFLDERLLTILHEFEARCR